jgi:hypothetical protein
MKINRTEAEKNGPELFLRKGCLWRWEPELNIDGGYWVKQRTGFQGINLKLKGFKNQLTDLKRSEEWNNKLGFEELTKLKRKLGFKNRRTKLNWWRNQQSENYQGESLGEKESTNCLRWIGIREQFEERW